MTGRKGEKAGIEGKSEISHWGRCEQAALIWK